MAASTFASALALLTCTAGAFPVYDVSEGAALQFNAGGTSFNSLGSLSPTQAIQCFANYASGGNGTCLILGLEGAEGDKQVSLEGSEFVFNANETLEISVAAFSAERAVVCYYDAANENRVTCRSLSVSDDRITGASEAKVINQNATRVPYAMTRISPLAGVICWSYTGYTKEGAGVCNKLSLDGDGEITVGAEFFIDEEHTSGDFSVHAFSETSAVLCWNAEKEGTCTTLLLDGGNLSKTTDAVFGQATDSNFEGLVVVSLTDEEGVVCWADGTAANQLECKFLMVGAANITVGAEAVVVNANPTAHISATRVKDPDTQEATALVCYASEPGHTSGEFRGNGTCNIVGLIGNETLGAGPANQVNARPTEYTALVTLESNSAILCYSGFGAGQGQCRALSMAETTTSTTATSSTSLTSTMTTTPHTLTATTITGNTVTDTSTTSPHTTTGTLTTTSPHTTTETTVTTATTTEGESSGSAATSLAGAGAAVAVALCLAA